MLKQPKIRTRLIVSAILFSLLLPNLSFAANKVSVRPVEPFYQSLPENSSKIYQSEVTYLSPLKDAPIEFSSLGATWDQKLPEGTNINLEIRLQNASGITDWYQLQDENEDVLTQPTDLNKASSFLATKSAKSYQYRIVLTTTNKLVTPVIQNLEFTFINGGTPDEKRSILNAQTLQAKSETVLEDHQDIPDEINSDAVLGKVKNKSLPANLVALAEKPVDIPGVAKKSLKKTTTTSTLKIISRAEWGADESLRVYQDDNKEAILKEMEDDYYQKFADELKLSKEITTNAQGQILTWPLEYPQSVRKIVVHHIATTKNLEDPARAIRDIYYWHTMSKGWGDIGYNYLIDSKGNIYEGRFGGEGVIGAHAGRGNNGSIGIALLGNFTEKAPTQAMINSLTALIKEKSSLYKIDTEGSSLFRGEIYPNVMGHRHIGQTSCPGEKVAELLPLIRTLSKVDLTSSDTKGAKLSNDYNFAFTTNPNLISLASSAKKSVSFTIKNTGTESWGEKTVFKINENSTSKSFLTGTLTSSAIGKTVKPGSEIKVTFNLTSTKTGGSGLIEFYPVINGTKVIKRYLSFPLQVEAEIPKPKYDYALESVVLSKNNYQAGDSITATIKIRNKGLTVWTKTGANKTTLGADKPRDHKNVLLPTPSPRLADMQENMVKYNEIATFVVKLKVPKKEGIYQEYFAPVIEGVTWLENRGTYLQIQVGNSQQVITNTTTTPATTVTASGGSSTNIATTALDLTAKPRALRIDLSYRGNPAIISADGEFYLYEGKKRLTSFVKDQQVTVKYENSIFKVTSGANSWTISSRPRFQPAVGSIMRIDNWERRNTWGDKANNNEFRGVLEVLIYNNELHLVNELPLEQYMKGIAEVGADQPVEKIKTIMVIARTYARFYMDVAKKFPGAPFDLNDDPNYSQKYIGYSFEKRSPVTTKYATETAGIYVTYQGKLIKTPYFSKSDGTKTYSAKDKWGWTDAPWLNSVNDSMCVSSAFSGHGVGLSGCGAIAMANQGKTYQEIIKYYYQGTEITKTQI